MLFTGTTCNDLPAALDLGGGVLSLPADQGRALMGVDGVKPPEALEILHFKLAKKCQKYTLVVHLHWITILSILLIKVLNSSTDAAVTNIIASLNVIWMKIWSVSWPVSLKFGKKQISKNILPLFFWLYKDN